MSRLGFASLHTGDPSVDQVQGYIATALQPLLALPFAAGNRVQNIDLTTGDTIVSHGLDSAPEGYIVLKQNADTSVYISPTANDFPGQVIILRSGASVNCDLFFF